MSSVYWMLELEVQAARSDAFKSLMREMVAQTEANEPGALSYTWSTNAEGTLCHIFERYADSAAVLKHMQGFGAFATRFFEVFKPLRFHVYGSPTEEVKGALAALNPVYLDEAAGFHR